MGYHQIHRKESVNIKYQRSKRLQRERMVLEDLFIRVEKENPALARYSTGDKGVEPNTGI